ncbi:MAG: hypothetical protein NZM43_05405 [Saprospiraceae bacterium]|nr:hypothetical protein [Saprospiraceae bacterium]MDW8483745.1 hypothetical protein [Saprospiraceae bacterium]
MLALFRTNESLAVFPLILYIVLLRMPTLLGWAEPPTSEQGPQGWVYQWLFGGLNFSPQASAWIATALVCLQAIVVNRLTDKYRMMEERTWMPGLSYGLVASFIPDFLFFSPALLVCSFIPVGLWQIFSVYRRPLVFSSIFDTAILFTAVVLLYPPGLWFLLMAFIGFFALRPFSAREQAVYGVGILTVFIIVQSALFWYDQLGSFWRIQVAYTFAWPHLVWPDALRQRLAVIALGLVILIAVLGFRSYYYKRITQVRKYIDLLYWFLLAGTLSALFRPGETLDGFLLCMPSVGVFYSYLFEAFRRNPFAELFHLCLFTATWVIQLSERLF